MPQRSLFGDFSGPTEAPPSYDVALTPQEFDAKTAEVAEQTRVASSKGGDPISGPSGKSRAPAIDYDEFEDWDDARFEAAAAAYQLRLARNAAASQAAATSSSTYHSPSPRLQEASSTSPPIHSATAPSPPPVASTNSPPPFRNGPRSPGQLPSSSRGDPQSPRNLPMRPVDHVSGPRSPRSSHTPRQVTSPVSEEGSSLPWLSRASSDGHGRPSLDAPPAFEPIDASMEFAASPTTEMRALQPNRASSSMDLPPLPPPTTQASSAPVQASNVFANVPPPPPILHIPQATTSAPLSHRHSDIPSPHVTSSSTHLPQRQRHSEIPNSRQPETHSLPERTEPPPTFLGWNQPGYVPPVEKQMGPGPSEPLSLSRALYASAGAKTSMPSVRIDLNRLAYQEEGYRSSTSISNQRQEAHAPSSFYASSVSSVLSQRPLPQPQARRPTEPQGLYANQNAPSNYSSPAASSYGDHRQSILATPGQGFYTQAQMQGPPTSTQDARYSYIPSQYQNQPTYAVPQQPPQGYPPTAAQNQWTPTPDTWRNYRNQ